MLEVTPTRVENQGCLYKIRRRPENSACTWREAEYTWKNLDLISRSMFVAKAVDQHQLLRNVHGRPSPPRNEHPPGDKVQVL